MESALFNATTINIIIGFAVLAFALIAIFTDSTPIKWVASILAIFGIGVLYRRMFPSDSEVKQKYEENRAAADQYFEDRKDALSKIHGNKKKVEELKAKKEEIKNEDANVQEKIDLVDTEIAQLEKQNTTLENSIEERQKKLDSFFSRKESIDSASKETSTASTSIGAYQLKGDVE